MITDIKASVVAQFGMLSGITLSVASQLAAADLSLEVAQAWTVAEQRSSQTIAWLNTTYGSPGMYSDFPAVGDPSTGHWSVVSNTRDWRNGFWPGTLWLLAQHTGSDLWKQRAMDWSAPLAQSTNTDHDIGFIVLASLGKGWLYHDESTDPGAAYRAFGKSAILSAAAKLDSRFNQVNSAGVPIPAGFTRSWNTPFEDPYPVCIDNLMNLEVMFLGYELSGRLPANRPWFDHALIHVRSSIARHLRADGGSYHVVKHFESGPKIGQIERKSTVQGYGDETTWSRGQAWAIYGLTSAYRYAHRDPATNATDILVAAQATADYFINHLPHYLVADAYNHRVGDFVPPSDFDAAMGEPTGPWNDFNADYNSSTGTGLGDRRPPSLAFTLRDSSAAAIAAAGLIELSRYAVSVPDRNRYLGAAEDILHCLITYDGQDQDSEPDYLCSVSDIANPGILKAGSVKWGDPNRSLIYGDFYFLEALARYEALNARILLERTQGITRVAPDFHFEFERNTAAPTLGFRVLQSPNLSEGSWTTVATKMGSGPWACAAGLTEEPMANGHTLVKIAGATAGNRGFFRVLTRSIGGDGP
ncbi:MAG: hypothetical protein ABI600_09115 [Luteolibacter sp.]